MERCRRRVRVLVEDDKRGAGRFVDAVLVDFNTSETKERNTVVPFGRSVNVGDSSFQNETTGISLVNDILSYPIGLTWASRSREVDGLSVEPTFPVRKETDLAMSVLPLRGGTFACDTMTRFNAVS